MTAILTYDNWKARLRGEALPIHESDPEIGFWRTREKDKKTNVVTMRAVAMWEVYGDIAGEVYDPVKKEFKNLNARGCEDIWTWVVRNPVTEAQYRAVTEGGEVWFDEVDVQAAAAAVDEAAAGFGADTSQPQAEKTAPPVEEEVDPVEALRAEVEISLKASQVFDEIKTDDDATKALTMRNTLNALALRGEKMYEAEIGPLNAAVISTKSVWERAKEAVGLCKKKYTFTDEARERGRKLRLLSQGYETMKANSAATEAAKAAPVAAPEPAASEAPQADAAGHSMTTTFAPTEMSMPAPAVQPSQPTTGRAVSRDTYDQVVIDDLPQVFMFFRDEPEVIEALTKIAQRFTDAGQTVPGTHTQKAVRIK